MQAGYPTIYGALIPFFRLTGERLASAIGLAVNNPFSFAKISKISHFSDFVDYGAIFAACWENILPQVIQASIQETTIIRFIYQCFRHNEVELRQIILTMTPTPLELRYQRRQVGEISRSNISSEVKYSGLGNLTKSKQLNNCVKVKVESKQLNKLCERIFHCSSTSSHLSLQQPPLLFVIYSSISTRFNVTFIIFDYL